MACVCVCVQEMNPDMERPMEDIWTDDMKREQQALKDGLAADLRSRYLHSHTHNLTVMMVLCYYII